MTTSPHTFTRPATTEEKPVWVLVRVGEGRTSYHQDSDCPRAAQQAGHRPRDRADDGDGRPALPVKKCGRCRI